MKCDLCEQEATVREVTVRNGVRVERHLCEKHAAESGIKVSPTQQIGEVLKSAIAGAAAQRVTACPACRTSFADFKQHGLLGCAECYRCFEPQLGPLLERAHDGLSRHCGKVPRRLAGEARARQPLIDLEARAEKLRRVREELERAVRAEQYEQAAKLRDQIKQLCQGTGAEAPRVGPETPAGEKD